jgi:6-phosphofructokinase 1
VVLIPEIPSDVAVVAESILYRARRGKHFSIVAIAEGAISREAAGQLSDAEKQVAKAKTRAAREKAEAALAALEASRAGHTLQLSRRLEELTGLESRVTILGHVQRGGTPTPADRVLATRLGTACADYIAQGVFGVLVAARGEGTEAVPLKDIVGKLKYVPLDHPWVESARRVDICLGDELPK